MIPMTLAALAAATGGSVLDGDPASTVTGPVLLDSRAVVPGSLFLAVRGERVDGHDYAAAAVAGGAAAVLAARPVGAPAVVVPDVVEALARLATTVAAQLPDAAVVGVTGSSGKTSTKDLLAGVLVRRGATVAPPGSYNNDLGHPLTVLRADAGTRYLVLEFGARGPGHIARLCRISPPHVAVVLNVGTAHLGEFGSPEATAAAKSELVRGLRAGGVAILNGDDPLVAAMAAEVQRNVPGGRVVTFGSTAAADVAVHDLRLDEAGRPQFTLVTRAGEAVVSLQLRGEHSAANAAAAAAVALELGMPLAEIAAALEDAVPASRHRLEVAERPDGVTIVDDAYNANPDSMRTALKTLAAMSVGRRSWAVLGAMRELGETSAELHDEIGRLAVRLGIDRLVAVGPDAARLHAGAVLEGSWGDEAALVPDVAAAVELLRAELRPGDVVLVKASRSEGLERVAEQLLAAGAAPDGPVDGPVNDQVAASGAGSTNSAAGARE